jgi:hypothetical protein
MSDRKKRPGPGQEATSVSPDDVQAKQRIAALKRERAGYETRGLTERVKAVDAELHKLGVDESPKPKGRTQRPQQTAAEKD